MTFTIESARLYIAEVRWQFAKTMPQWPHEYTVREWREDLDTAFSAFATLIRSDAVVRVVAIDLDGQVHFVILPGSVESNRHLLGQIVS